MRVVANIIVQPLQYDTVETLAYAGSHTIDISAKFFEFGLNKFFCKINKIDTNIDILHFY